MGIVRILVALTCRPHQLAYLTTAYATDPKPFIQIIDLGYIDDMIAASLW